MKNIQTLSGFKDFLPAETRLKHLIIQKFTNNLELFGYNPIETPHLEYAAILSDQIGEETNKQIYRFTDHGNREVGLRFDHTLPLARFWASNRANLPLPFKRYVIGNVFRGERPQVGRYREFTQCDFDYLGSPSSSADVEIVEIIASCLKAVGVSDFVIKINHRQLLEALLRSICNNVVIEPILQITDKLPKLGHDKTAQELVDNHLLDIKQANHWLDLIGQSFNTGRQLLDFIEKNINQKQQELLSTVKQVIAILDNLEDLQGHWQWDLSIARGLLYYTGLVFETFITAQESLGSICSGGRYDNLTSNFSNITTPGVGASIGVDRLLFYLNERSTDKLIRPKSLLLAIIDSAVSPEAHKIASQLRANKILVDIYHQPQKIKKYFSYAEKMNYNFLLVCGELELKNAQYTLADLASGHKSSMLSLEQIIHIINN